MLFEDDPPATESEFADFLARFATSVPVAPCGHPVGDSVPAGDKKICTKCGWIWSKP